MVVSQDTGIFVEIVNKLGLVGFFAASVTAFLWKMLPVLLKKWRSQTQQQQAIADNIPRMERHLDRMANEHGKTLNEMNSKLDRLVDSMEKAVGSKDGNVRR